MFYRLLALVKKELQALFRDPQTRRLLLAPVIMQLALFPFAATLEVKNNTLAVLNEDQGVESYELLQRLERVQAFTHVLQLTDEHDLEQCMGNQKALVAVRFPADFSRRLAVGDSSALQVIVDGRRSNSGQIAMGYIQNVLRTYLDERGTLRGRPAPPSELVVRHWFNPNLRYVWFVIPCLVAVITTTSTLVVSAMSISREREQGTFDQLLVSPLTSDWIMLGKAIPAALVGCGQATLILTGGVFIYGVPFQGSLLLLYASMVFYIVALVGFGFLIASICSTQQQCFLGIFSFIMPAIMLSGFASPVDNMPHWLQVLTWFNPLRHFIIIVKGIFLKNVGWEFVVNNSWPLAVIGVVTLTAASSLFHRRTA
ncbi:MAG TPA: ABC transporter permease [Candidatus Limnocylindria bacterium]|jgi:ABC-2 type transport system permease protein|nr:ABC transporter permease [Candidatus Limnocylindria bacterium]